MSETVADKVRSRLDAGFTYKPDEGEDWRSHIEAVRSGHEWLDDCDGYALSAAQCAIEDFGVKPENVAIAYCLVGGAGHLACLITEDGVTRSVDTASTAAWEWSSLGYQWISAMRLSEPGVWRKVEV